MSHSKPQSVTGFILTVLKPYKGYLAVIALVGVLWAVINTLLPYILKIIIDKVVGFQGDRAGVFAVIQPWIIFYILYLPNIAMKTATWGMPLPIQCKKTGRCWPKFFTCVSVGMSALWPCWVSTSG